MPWRWASSVDDLQPCRALALVGRLPASQRCRQHQVVVVRLPPVLVGYVRTRLVLLAPEVEQFLPELGPPLKPLGHLQSALVEWDLQGCDEILLRDGVLLGAVAIDLLAKAGDGHRDVVEAPLLKEVGDGHPDARLIHDKFGGGPGYPTTRDHGCGEGRAGEQALHLIRYIGVGRLERKAFQVPKVQLGPVLARLWVVSGNLLQYGQGSVVC